MKKVLFVGDIHYKHSNLIESEILFDKLKNLTESYDFAVLAGDILDTHERVDTQLMNRAYDLIRMLKKKSHVYICVGNHDMINNQQFLTSNHWMNGMKEWNNVTVVDSPILVDDFVFVPYIYPGRFIEALNLIPSWKTSRCIFAHQEILGCKMGAFISKDGDEWDISWPCIISGHIHDRQCPQSNVLYPGSLLPGRFYKDQGLSIFTFYSDKACKYTEQRIPLDIKQKKTIHSDIGNSINIKDLNTNTRIVMIGSIDEIAAHKKSKQASVIKQKGSKIVYKLKDEVIIPKQFPERNFITILDDLVCKIGDDELTEDYKLIS